MRELSLNILDISKNSVSAGASQIIIEICEDCARDLLSITIRDNGCGMSESFLKDVTDPFVTTRKSRKVGLGLPLFKLACESAGGALEISSKLGLGTCVYATLELGHIDRMPIGDMVTTLQSLIHGNPEIEWIYRHKTDLGAVGFSSLEIRDLIGEEIPINTPEIIAFIGEYLNEKVTILYKGADS